MAEEEITAEEQILINALAPKRASGDSGSAEQHPIADQISALRLARQATARRSSTVPLRTFGITPKGTAE